MWIGTELDAGVGGGKVALKDGTTLPFHPFPVIPEV